MNFIVGLFTGLAAVSLPVTYLLEHKYGCGKKARLFHGICAAAGALIVAADSLLCYRLASTLRTPYVGDWAKDFFFGYLWTALPAVLVITGLLAAAAAIDHPMRRIRMAVTILLPLIVTAATLFVASLASGGQFAVDLYIRALAPGLGFLPHLVPLCERGKKSRRS